MLNKRIFCIFFICVIVFLLYIEIVTSTLTYMCRKYNFDVDNFCILCSSETIKIKSDNYKKFLQKFNVEVVSQKYIDDRLVIEGYTNLLNNYYVSGNRKLNIQISVFDNDYIVGYPYIEGSF